MSDPLAFRMCSQKSLNAFRREANVHYQVSFWKGYVLVVDQLLYVSFESFVVLDRVPYWSYMISILHIKIIPRQKWLWELLERSGNHRRASNQRLQELTIFIRMRSRGVFLLSRLFRGLGWFWWWFWYPRPWVIRFEWRSVQGCWYVTLGIICCP